MAVKNNNQLSLAIAYITLACFGYTIMGVCVKEAAMHTPIQIIVFVRYFLLLIFMLPFFFTGKSASIHPKRPWLLVARGFIGVLGASLTFFAIRDIPLSTAVLLSSTEPIFIPFILRIGWNVKILPKPYIGVFVGLFGVALVLHPTHGYFQLGAFLALAAGLSRAFSITLIRVISKSDSTKTMMLYFFFVGSLVSFIASLTHWHHWESWSWGWMFAVAAASMVFQFGLTKSLSHAPARIMGPFNYISVVFAVIADAVLWGQSLSMMVGFGIMLVVLGAVLTVLLGRDIIHKK